MEEENNETQESLPVDEQGVPSTPPQQAEAQTPTAEQGEIQQEEQKQTPFHEHPRWQEMKGERDWYRQQLELQLQKPIPQPTISQQQPDPYAGMTPEEEKFWRINRNIAREEAQKVAEEKSAEFKARFDVIQGITAKQMLDNFRRAHPDIKPNSSEELEIANKISAGYSDEDAYRVVMWDKHAANVTKQTQQQNKQRLEAKKQANVETGGSPSNVKSHIKENLSLRERIERNFNDLASKGEISY